MEIKGTIKNITPVQMFGAKNFKKAEIWIEIPDGQYPQTISVEATKDKADEIQSLQVGMEIKCSINLRGRLWSGDDGVEKVFNSIQLWKYETIGSDF